MLTRTKQQGSSLVELMIAMLLGLVSLSILASVTGYGIGTNANLLSQARLTEEMRAALFMISRDLRRIGINGGALSRVQDPSSNPSDFAGSIVLGAYPGEPQNSCILFRYDTNLNGTADAAKPNENFGFRLREGAIEIRQAGATCDEVGWQDLTDSQVIDITDLTFSLELTTSHQITCYQIDVKIMGELAGRPEFNRYYQERLMVRAYD